MTPCIQFLSSRQFAKVYSCTLLPDHLRHLSRARAQSLHSLKFRSNHAINTFGPASEKVWKRMTYDKYCTALQTSPTRYTTRVTTRHGSAYFFLIIIRTDWRLVVSRKIRLQLFSKKLYYNFLNYPWPYSHRNQPILPRVAAFSISFEVLSRYKSYSPDRIHTAKS